MSSDQYLTYFFFFGTVVQALTPKFISSSKNQDAEAIESISTPRFTLTKSSSLIINNYIN